MLILRANTDDLSIVTGSAADIEVHLSAMQADASTPPVVQPLPNLGPLASITTATTTMVLDTSGITSAHVVNVKHMNIYNNHASQASTVRAEVADGTNTTVLANVNLLAGESLVLTQGGVWLHYDSNGGLYPSVGNAASQAEMEAGTAPDKYVTPQGMKWHPGVAKAIMHTTGTATPVADGACTYGCTLTDSGVGRLTVNFSTAFSAVDAYEVQSNVEVISTTLTAAANVMQAYTRFGGQASASACEQNCCDRTATTNVIRDPIAWHICAHGDQA